jgi:transposase
MRPERPDGDRQLNRAIHTITVTRMRCHQPTQAYVQRRRAEGKTDREIRRCIKRYLARHLYRTLANPAPRTPGHWVRSPG